MPTTSDQAEPEGRRLAFRDELYWILPIGLTLAGGVAFLLFNESWGANIAAILALPVEVVGVIFAILTAKGVSGWTGSRKPRLPRSRRRITVYLSVLILMLSGVVYYFVREPDPFDYMSGDVRIGFVSPGYPGWNEGTGVGRTGFNVAVGRALLDYFPDMTSIQWVELENNEDRIAALAGEARVKLVISNFSITEGRKREIDFAGPYFIDAGGFATHNKKATSWHDLTRVCVPAGSTAQPRMQKLSIETISEPTLRGCLQRFFADGESDLAVATDLSIIQSYVGSLPLEKRKEVAKFLSLGSEDYGIGPPNNSPKLCAKINEALARFLRVGWTTAFKDSLGKLGVKEHDTEHDVKRRPDSLRPCEPAAPWRK